ncbi:MAG: class I SAM-dependent methyltransferase [Bacteroidales bacterium]|jgi:SAM-dependent methyltransferase|nr:class I SAM-dependent methyltransferase [Bacteroidales bacterium]MDD4214328.1 class I SAM-dependent methyltransferase [Bacteroidales bacterium]
MANYTLIEKATEENFTEEAYLAANFDVAIAIKKGVAASGRQHFELFGKEEGRNIRLPISTIVDAKICKQEKVKPLLRNDMPYIETENLNFDFLSDDFRETYNIVDTDMVSSNIYEPFVLDLINKYEHGLILDCGAGQRDIYYDNVVNLEIVDYDTTDVLAVGEQLPFKDNAFDALISLSVLEHVKDPFLCAKEIARVLKPGGELLCSVPFLQPYHGYPHHYYNMTSRGLENLFDGLLITDKTDISPYGLPIWSLTWILRNWANGLKDEAKEEFLRMKVSELLEEGDKYYHKAFVRELEREKNFELANATLLFAHKKNNLIFG